MRPMPSRLIVIPRDPKRSGFVPSMRTSTRTRRHVDAAVGRIRFRPAPSRRMKGSEPHDAARLARAGRKQPSARPRRSHRRASNTRDLRDRGEDEQARRFPSIPSMMARMDPSGAGRASEKVMTLFQRRRDLADFQVGSFHAVRYAMNRYAREGRRRRHPRPRLNVCAHVASSRCRLATQRIEQRRDRHGPARSRRRNAAARARQA